MRSDIVVSPENWLGQTGEVQEKPFVGSEVVARIPARDRNWCESFVRPNDNALATVYESGCTDIACSSTRLLVAK
jgi:hypothetical protein